MLHHNVPDDLSDKTADEFFDNTYRKENMKTTDSRNWLYELKGKTENKLLPIENK